MPSDGEPSACAYIPIYSHDMSVTYLLLTDRQTDT